MDSNQDTFRLKESLRKALKVVKRQQGKQSRRTQSMFIHSNEPPPVLPNISEVSLFPSFGSSRFDIDNYSASTPRRLASRPSSVTTWESDLLPVKSLSQLNLHEAYNRDVKPLPASPGMRYGSTRNGKAEFHHPPSFHSLHAQVAGSMTTLPSLKSSRSSLRIPANGQDLPPDSPGPLYPTLSFRSSRSTLRIPTSGQAHLQQFENPLKPLSSLARSHSSLHTPRGSQTFQAPVADPLTPPPSLKSSLSSLQLPTRCQTSHDHLPTPPNSSSMLTLPSLRRSTSSLQDSRDIIRDTNSRLKSDLSSPVPGLRKLKGSQNLRASSMLMLRPTSVTDSQPKIFPGEGKVFSPAKDAQNQTSANAISHFGSFCVLDTYAPGCPVSATSEDLRHNLDVGEQFYLNTQELMEGSMDMVTGTDIDGNEIVHLTLFCPLITADDGKKRFVLACLVNVTDFIREAADEPYAASTAKHRDSIKVSEPENRGDKGISSCTLRDGTSMKAPMEQRDAGFQERGDGFSERSSFDSFSTRMDDEDLLGGCILPRDSRRQKTMTKSALGNRVTSADMSSVKHPSPLRSSTTLPTIEETSRPMSATSDIWLNLIDQECQQHEAEGSSLPNHPALRSSTATPTPTATTVSTPSTPRSYSPLSSNTSTSTSSSLDTLLSHFMTSLQRLYSTIFILSLSPLSSAFYEIHHVSPTLYASGSHVTGHLSHTAPEIMAEMGRRLDGQERFRMEVRWGDEDEDGKGGTGVEMQCYCVPVWGRRGNVAWVCLLVGIEEGLLW